MSDEAINSVDEAIRKIEDCGFCEAVIHNAGYKWLINHIATLTAEKKKLDDELNYAADYANERNALIDALTAERGRFKDAARKYMQAEVAALNELHALMGVSDE